MSNRNDDLLLVRPMKSSDLELVLTWRNHPNIRSFMYTQHEITPDEHRRWFHHCSLNPRKHLLIFEKNHVPLGFVNFSEVEGEKSAEWGFYMAPKALKGSGRELGFAALSYAFGELELEKIIGEVLTHNLPSIQFHKMLGFKEKGILPEAHFDGKHHHSVICFQMLSGQWRSNS